MHNAHRGVNDLPSLDYNVKYRLLL